MSSAVAVFELVLGMLTLAVVLWGVAGRTGLPPAVAYLGGGLLLGLVPGVPRIALDPDLALVLFLPPLLMASATFTVWRDFVRELRPILGLAVGAVLFTTWAVGYAAKLVAPELSWPACLALGAIVSPPDAVAAKAVLQHLPLPRRLTTILEGESLVNDAAGLILYRYAVVAALTGHFSLPEAAGGFVWLAIGGLAAGIAVAYAANALLDRLRDQRLVVLVSFLVAWASYLAAETVHASGVLAVVACGLVLGRHQHEVMDAAGRLASRATWQSLVFALEALVFILIGLTLFDALGRVGDGAGLAAVLPLVATVAAAAIGSRIAWVFAATAVQRMIPSRVRPGSKPLSWRLTAVVAWSGMRGVVSLAAALALPLGFAGRDAILLATLGVIVSTLVLQGMTLGPLVRLLKLEPEAEPPGLSEEAARAAAIEAGVRHLELGREVDGSPDHPQLLATFRQRSLAAGRARDEEEGARDLRRTHYDAWLQTLEASRRELTRLHREDALHDDVLHAIETEIDLEELRIRRLRPDRA